MALSTDIIRNNPEKGGRLFLPVRADQVIHEGALIAQRRGTNLAEIADPNNPRNDLIVRGVARNSVDTTGKANGSANVGVDPGLWGDFKSAGGLDEITTDDLDALVFMLDDDTLSLTDQTGTLSPAGRVRFVDDDGYITIEIEDQPIDYLVHEIDTVSQTVAGWIAKRTVTIDYSPGGDNFAGKANGVKTFSKALSGGALPANARYLGHTIGESTFVDFDDATHGTYTIKVGQASDDDDVIASVNVAAGQSGFPKAGTPGVRAFNACPLYAEAVTAVLTSSVNLNTVSAGQVTIELFYFVKA